MATEFPITDVVTVNISRETLFPTGAGFGTSLLAGTGTDAGVDHGERVRFYSSPDAVAADWPANTEEFAGLGAGFRMSPRPTRVAFGLVLTASPAGFAKGGAVDLAATIAIADGEFSVSIDGVANDIAALNFTTDTTVAQIAARIETAIQLIGTGGFTAATCVDIGGRLKITSGTTGALSKVSALAAAAAPAGTDISGSGFLDFQADVATIVDGYDWVNLTDEMNRNEAANPDWYGFGLSRDLSSTSNYQAMAAWAETRKKICAAFDESLIALDPTSTSDLPYLLKNSGYQRTFCQWSDDGAVYPEMEALARLAVVDYLVPNSAITMKFKVMPGVAAVSITPSQRDALLAKNSMIYTLRAGLTGLEEGKMSGGEFIDVMHSLDWLEDTLSVDLFGTIATSATKISMTDTGMTQLEQVVEVDLDIAVTAAILGSTVDEDTGELIPAYTITVPRMATHPQSQRAARIAPPITFDGVLAGAIHFASVEGVVTV